MSRHEQATRERTHGVRRFDGAPATSHTHDMRAPRRKRPLRRQQVSPPAGAALSDLAQRASYVGSPEHKTFPSFAGPPQPRADASKCNPRLADREQLTGWLRAAIADGQIAAPWEVDFPRYVYYRHNDLVYEGRLVNPVLGEYKGYPLQPDEWPGWLK
jgi:hypothetical protein